MGAAEVESCLPGVVATYAEALASSEAPTHVMMATAGAEIDAWVNAARPRSSKLFYRLVDLASQETVGVAWLELDGVLARAYLAYILIAPSFRRRGYARRALALIDRLARRAGAGRIYLNAFGHDERALALYLGAGYTVTRMFTVPGPSEAIRCRLVKTLERE